MKHFEKPGRPVDRVFLHCSASDNPDHDSVHVIRRWHTAEPPEGNGWGDVGYHFFIQKNGGIQQGRALEVSPAAQKGHNTGTIAICCHGLRDFTEAQKSSVHALCKEINEAYSGKITFHGHCEVSNKSCPVYPYKKWLRLDQAGYMKRKLTFFERVALLFNQWKGN